MLLQYINEFLQLTELQLHSIISIDSQEVHFESSKWTSIQPNSVYCTKQEVKRDGQNSLRKVRHLSLFGKKSDLHIVRRGLIKYF